MNANANKLVLILSGIPGSGKSTFGKKYSGNEDSRITCSANDYFMKSGKYEFDVSKLGQAHKACMRKFLTHLILESIDLIIVDNTNTTALEIAPYYMAAISQGYRVELHSFDVSAEVGASRNIHGVSLHSCQIMARRFAEFQVPPFWEMTRTYHLGSSFCNFGLEVTGVS